MDTRENAVYSLYTPLRNHIRQANLISSLRAIHAHIQHYQFGQPLPSYIRNVPFGYQHINSFEQLLNFHLFPWELEVIVKELIIHADPYGIRKTFEDWNYLCGAVNKLKSLEDSISGLYITENNVLDEIAIRLSHREFVWQRKPSMALVGRYWKIYSHPQLAPIVLSSLGMPVETLYIITFALIGVFQDKFALFYPPRIEQLKITLEDLDKFMKHFSLPMTQLREKLKSEQQMNDKYVYAYNSLHAYPLIQTMYEQKNAIVCPIPGLLYRRLTEGLYYELCRTPGFDNAYGQAFQDYVGKVIHNANPTLIVQPEFGYGGRRSAEKTSDWIVYDKETTLLVECKGKRLTFEAKSSLLDDTAINEQIEIMSKAIVQIYKTMFDFQNNRYSLPNHSDSKAILPLVVTLEEWYLFGGKLTKLLDKKVREKLANLNISADTVDNNPYTVCSVDSLIYLMQASRQNNVKTMLLHKWNDSYTREWTLDNFLMKYYPPQTTNIEDKSPGEKELESALFN